MLPDERINIYEEPELFHEELRRCFPRDMDKVLAFYRLLSDLNGRINQIMDLNPFSFRPFLQREIRKGKKPVMGMVEDIGTDQRFASFIRSQLSSFSYLSGAISLTASSSILESSRKGVCSIEGGSDGLKGLLMDRIKALGGGIIDSPRVKDISMNGNRWLLRTEDEAFSGRAVIGNIDSRSFCSLFLDGGKKYLRKAEKVEKGLLALVVNLGAKDAGLPVGMSENVIMLRDYKKGYVLDNLLMIQMSPPANGRRVIGITCHVPLENCLHEEKLRGVAEKMVEGVGELCPFIERHVEAVDIRYPESSMDGVYTTSLSQKMGVGILPPEIVHRKIFFAGPEVFPSLGFDGLVYSGRMAAAAALTDLESGME